MEVDIWGWESSFFLKVQEESLPAPPATGNAASITRQENKVTLIMAICPKSQILAHSNELYVVPHILTNTCQLTLKYDPVQSISQTLPCEMHAAFTAGSGFELLQHLTFVQHKCGELGVVIMTSMNVFI